MASLYGYYSEKQYNTTGFNYQYLNQDTKEIICCSEVSETPPEVFLKDTLFDDMVYLGTLSKYIRNYKSHIDFRSQKLK